jgi:hypothetical protein
MGVTAVGVTARCDGHGATAVSVTAAGAAAGGGTQGTLLIFHTNTEPAIATRAVAANSVG